MEQTLRYIKVLNWGYGGFSPMTLTPDYKGSLDQLQERLALLEGLSYDALLVEATSANGKADLERYKSTDTTFEYQLHFMRDRQQLLEALQPDYYEKDGDEVVLVENPNRMFRPLLKVIDKFRADGLWTDEQWKECRWTIETIEKQFEERLRQFAAAYDYKTEQEPEPQQIPPQLATPEAQNYFARAIELGLMDSNYNWLKGLQMLSCFAREMSIKLKLGKGERISWKPFEILFGVEQGKLRLNYNDIQKTGQDPSESYLVDRIFW
ncbi:MAG: hypothetical protein K5764_01580 [Prevotella sp.]|nr:hypothetical protein [Prevotella sp.]